MIKTEVITLTTVLLAFFVRKTAEQRQLLSAFHTAAFIPINLQIPPGRNRILQFRQSNQLLQRQQSQRRSFQQPITARQILQRPPVINRKFEQNSKTRITGFEFPRSAKLMPRREHTDGAQKKAGLQRNRQLAFIPGPVMLSDKFQQANIRNKSVESQFVRLRKLLGFTSDKKSAQLPVQWFTFPHGLLNFSNRLSTAVNIGAASQRQLLTTTAASILQNKKNSDKKDDNPRLSSFRNNSPLTSDIQKLSIPSTFDRPKDVILRFGTMLPRQQQLQQETQLVAVQKMRQISTVSKPTAPLATFTEQPSPESSSSQGVSLPGPPGFLPPSDEVIAQLNGAQNFRALAESIQLGRHFKNDTN